MKWIHDHVNLGIFLKEANSFHPIILFKAEVLHVFLVTKSRRMGNEINMDLYTKPTDTHQYLLSGKLRRRVYNTQEIVTATSKARSQGREHLLQSRNHQIN